MNYYFWPLRWCGSQADCGDSVDIERKLHCVLVINFRQIVMEGGGGGCIVTGNILYIVSHLSLVQPTPG